MNEMLLASSNLQLPLQNRQDKLFRDFFFSVHECNYQRNVFNLSFHICFCAVDWLIDWLIDQTSHIDVRGSLRFSKWHLYKKQLRRMRVAQFGLRRVQRTCRETQLHVFLDMMTHKLTASRPAGFRFIHMKASAAEWVTFFWRFPPACCYYAQTSY